MDNSTIIKSAGYPVVALFEVVKSDSEQAILLMCRRERIANGYIVRRSDKTPTFHRGQNVLRRVGHQWVPVTFLMVGPRTVIAAGKELVTFASGTAIVAQRNGPIAVVPIRELRS